MNFKDKNVWITGASSGIGEALSKELSDRGAKLILSARRSDQLQRVQNECSHPESIGVFPLDLEKNEQASKWVEACWKQYGPIDVVISNGGIGQLGESLHTLEAVERKIFEINYFGSVALTKALLPRMLSHGNGHILVISSITGKFGQAKLAAYSASKAALLLYYESLNQELKYSPVKIQVVSPGFIQTNVSLNSLLPDGSRSNANSPAQENGMPPGIFAKKLIKVMGRNRFHSYIGRKELIAVPLHAVFPGLFYCLLGNKKS